MIERLMKYVSPEPNSGCWLWTGARCWGYGYTGSGGGKSRRAHRVFYELYKGPIPEGLQIDHKCMVKCCVNPDHLEAVTAQENTLRATKAGIGGVAKKLAQTHCVHGHELKGGNVRINSDGTRRCRTCFNECKRMSSRRMSRARGIT